MDQREKSKRALWQLIFSVVYLAFFPPILFWLAGDIGVQALAGIDAVPAAADHRLAVVGRHCRHGAEMSEAFAAEHSMPVGSKSVTSEVN